MADGIKTSDIFDELTFSFSRSGGPGGQNVNKVNSKVTLRWDVKASTHISDELRATLLQKLSNRITSSGVLVITEQASRSQHQNKESALKNLGALLQRAQKTKKKRKATKPTKAAKQKRLEGKRHHSEKKQLRRKI